MKTPRILLLFIVLFVLINKANSIVYDLPRFLDEISQLYAQERMDVIKAKMLNSGFKLTASEPDYELNGRGHKLKYEYFINDEEYRGKIYFEATVDDKIINYEVMVSFTTEYAKGEIEGFKAHFSSKPNHIVSKNNPNNWIDDQKRNMGYFGDAIWGVPAGSYGYGLVEDNKLWFKLILRRPEFPAITSNNSTETQLRKDSQIENVQMKKINGHYYVRTIMGGKGFDFLFDTGASDFLINARIEQYLIEAGIIRESDYLPSQDYETANGVVTLRRVRIAKLRFGNITLTNIEAGISPGNATPLFGVSALNKFQTWKVNSKTNVLTIKKF